MATSEEFKQQLKAGDLRQALKVALMEAIELKITTRVVPTAVEVLEETTASTDDYMFTRINIVDGSIENQIGRQFLNSGTYSELREFHLDQVNRGQETIHLNLQNLQRLYDTLAALLDVVPAESLLSSALASSSNSIEVTETELSWGDRDLSAPMNSEFDLSIAAIDPARSNDSTELTDPPGLAEMDSDITRDPVLSDTTDIPNIPLNAATDFVTDPETDPDATALNPLRNDGFLAAQPDSDLDDPEFTKPSYDEIFSQNLLGIEPEPGLTLPAIATIRQREAGFYPEALDLQTLNFSADLAEETSEDSFATTNPSENLFAWDEPSADPFGEPVGLRDQPDATLFEAPGEENIIELDALIAGSAMADDEMPLSVEADLPTQSDREQTASNISDSDTPLQPVLQEIELADWGSLTTVEGRGAVPSDLAFELFPEESSTPVDATPVDIVDTPEITTVIQEGTLDDVLSLDNPSTLSQAQEDVASVVSALLREQSGSNPTEIARGETIWGIDHLETETNLPSGSLSSNELFEEAPVLRDVGGQYETEVPPNMAREFHDPELADGSEMAEIAPTEIASAEFDELQLPVTAEPDFSNADDLWAIASEGVDFNLEPEERVDSLESLFTDAPAVSPAAPEDETSLASLFADAPESSLLAASELENEQDLESLFADAPDLPVPTEPEPIPGQRPSPDFTEALSSPELDFTNDSDPVQLDDLFEDLSTPATSPLDEVLADVDLDSLFIETSPPPEIGTEVTADASLLSPLPAHRTDSLESLFDEPEDPFVSPTFAQSTSAQSPIVTPNSTNPQEVQTLPTDFLLDEENPFSELLLEQIEESGEKR